MYAQRAKKVYAAAATWARLIKDGGWLRPRKRLYPDKPTEVIRASRPGDHLHSFAALEKLIAWYVGEHNAVIPHSAFRGQTPDEMFFGRGDRIPEELDAARRQARVARLQANRNVRCEDCRPQPTSRAPSQAVALAEKKAA